MKITFDFLEDNGFPSVTDYCRHLVKIGHKDEPIEIYRGDLLCITVSSIYQAAKLEPRSAGGFRFYKRPTSVL